MIIPATSQKRQNRTVVLHLGNTLAEYKTWLSREEHKDELLRRVEIADDLNWCRLADGHHPECQRRLQFTHHGHRYYDFVMMSILEHEFREKWKERDGSESG